MIEKVQGFAVVLNDKVNINTISETERAAMVNWLVVECKILIYSTTTDEQIEELWFKYRRRALIEIVEVVAVKVNKKKPMEFTESKPTISDEEIEKWVVYACRLGHDMPRSGFKEVLDTIINGGFLTLQDWSDHIKAMNSIES